MIKLEVDVNIDEEENIITDFNIYSCILYHLVGNSMKHSPPNTLIRIILSFAKTQNSDFNGILTTRVIDQGPGID
jgi:signal transduction histidine kinase